MLLQQTTIPVVNYLFKKKKKTFTETYQSFKRLENVHNRLKGSNK